MYLLSLFLLLPSSASAADPTSLLRCDYRFQGFAVAQLELPLFADGSPADFVRVILQGKPHLESFTVDTPGEGQAVRGWVSKGHPDNEIEMVVYQQAQRSGNSKIVNHRVPMGKEVWGECVRE